jgi:outer membrane protein
MGVSVSSRIANRRGAARAGAVVALIGFALSAAGTAGALTLTEAYALALQNDPKFRSAQAEARAGGMALDQARAGFLPTARFDLDKIESRSNVLRNDGVINVTGARTFWTTSGTLTVTQPIFRREVIARIEQARSVVKQAEFTRLAAEQDLMVRTTAAYLSVLAATDSVGLAQTEREAVGKVYELARERLRAGLGTATNLYDAQARFAITQAREVEAGNKLRDAQQALREITGRVYSGLRSLRAQFPLETPQPAVVERWVDAALDQNLLLRARRESVEVARQEVERQRAGHYPSVNLLLSHNRRDASGSFASNSFQTGNLVETTDLTLRLSLPIFEGGLTSAVTAEAAHRFQKSLEDLELERRAIERATRASFDATTSAVNLVEALRQAVLSQESALEAREQGFKSGLFTLLQVLDAQRDLYLARRDYAQSRYDYLLFRLRLKLAAGTLAEADLVDVGAALQ